MGKLSPGLLFITAVPNTKLCAWGVEDRGEHVLSDFSDCVSKVLNETCVLQNDSTELCYCRVITKLLFITAVLIQS
jgi:hypothetical protein